jgi:glycosyltransferase involved in cell wall biosynthesis
MYSSLQPLVSVIIPTYNRPYELKKCLDSIINQTYRNLEIIISDNCSDIPEVITICNRYAKEDNRVKCFRQKENIGVYKNIAFLIEKANGKYTLTISDDDWIDLNYIEETLRMLENNPDCCIAVGRFRQYNDDYSVLTDKCFHHDITGDYPNRLFDYLDNCMVYAFAGPLVRTENYKICQCYILRNNNFCGDQINYCELLYFGTLMINKNTVFHKLQNGHTKDFETVKKSYNLDSVDTYDDLVKLRNYTVMEALLYDGFLKKYMSKKEIIDLVFGLYHKFIREKFYAT